MVAPDSLADLVTADLKAVLAGWVYRRRLSRAAVKALMGQISKRLDGWVRQLQQPQRKESHGHSNPQSQLTA